MSEVVAEHLRRAGCTPRDLCELMHSLDYRPHALTVRRAGLRHVLRLEPADSNALPTDVLWVPGDGLATERLRADGTRRGRFARSNVAPAWAAARARLRTLRLRARRAAGH